MIEKLYIKNFAIVDEMEISFDEGLTIITGETGSGKSILLQALNVSLGGKTSKTMVRSNTESAVIETKLNSTVYRRVLSKSGRTKSYLNDEPFTENNYRSVCSSLVDFHGQHEQQYIMKDSSHIDYLDAFCGINNRVENCTALFNSIKHDTKILSELLEKKQSAEQHQELLSFQLNEISTINPEQYEDVKLEKELQTLKHLDELVETANRISIELTDDDESIYNKMSSSLNALEKLVNIDPKLTEYSELIRSASLNVQDTSAGLNDYVNSLNHDKNRLIEIQDRLGAIDSLKRKYGGSIVAILNAKDQIIEDINNHFSIDLDIQKVKKTISDKKTEYQNLAEEIHTDRTRGSEILSKAIENEMLQLNMQDARFEIQITQKIIDNSFALFEGNPVLANEKGFDNIKFLLSANPGERLKPLVEIASGGEISRIMLAIKTVFQNNDPVDSLVFDEIDSGISGVAAEKVANSLVNLAKSKQVICITHL
ncbi:MAG: DNA repair protein RecN, partial [Candidatus Marinimicrobia bacterium]|nr:DNA repair protein RecN [Candidatus Neomarinimicrobiota bacterium]